MGNALMALGCLIMLLPIFLVLVIFLAVLLWQVPYIGWVFSGLVILFAVAVVGGAFQGWTRGSPSQS